MIHLTDHIKGYKDPRFLNLLDLMTLERPTSVSGVVESNLSEGARALGIKDSFVEENSYQSGFLRFIIDPRNDGDQQNTGPLVAELELLVGELFSDYLEKTHEASLVEGFKIQSAWVVCQMAGDFASLHHHKPNDYAGIVYLQSPSSLNLKDFPSGFMTILEGERSVSIPPIQASIYFWPASYWHTVYPFRGVGEKIAIAFNIDIDGS